MHQHSGNILGPGTAGPDVDRQNLLPPPDTADRHGPAGRQQHPRPRGERLAPAHRPRVLHAQVRITAPADIGQETRVRLLHRHVPDLTEVTALDQARIHENPQRSLRRLIITPDLIRQRPPAQPPARHAPAITIQRIQLKLGTMILPVTLRVPLERRLKTRLRRQRQKPRTRRLTTPPVRPRITPALITGRPPAAAATAVILHRLVITGPVRRSPRRALKPARIRIA